MLPLTFEIQMRAMARTLLRGAGACRQRISPAQRRNLKPVLNQRVYLSPTPLHVKPRVAGTVYPLFSADLSLSPLP